MLGYTSKCHSFKRKAKKKKLKERATSISTLGYFLKCIYAEIFGDIVLFITDLSWTIRTIRKS